MKKSLRLASVMLISSAGWLAEPFEMNQALGSGYGTKGDPMTVIRRRGSRMVNLF